MVFVIILSEILIFGDYKELLFSIPIPAATSADLGLRLDPPETSRVIVKYR